MLYKWFIKIEIELLIDDDKISGGSVFLHELYWDQKSQKNLGIVPRDPRIKPPLDLLINCKFIILHVVLYY